VADNYNIDDLLAELRAKRTAIENKTASPAAKPAVDVPADKPAVDWDALLAPKQPEQPAEPEAEKPAATKAEEIRRVLEGSESMEQFGELPEQPEQPEQPAEAEDKNPGEEEPVQGSKNPLRSALRSISEQLTASFDPIETGEFCIGHSMADEDDEAGQTDEQHLRAETVESHPVFATQATATYVIPAAKPQETDELQQQATVSFTAAQAELPKKEKGILNVKENADESFREFFGDTVLVEHEDRRGPRRVREVSVFDDDEPEMADEYRSEEDAEDILAQLMSAKGRALGRIVAGAVLSFALLLVAMSSVLQLSETVYYLLSALLMLVCVLCNLRTVMGGTAKLFMLRADITSLCGFSALLSLLQCVVLFAAGSPVQPVSCFISALALTVCAVGDYLDGARTLGNFRAIAQNPKKYASVVLADQDFTRMLTHELHVGEANVLIKRRTGFTDNFLAHSQSSDARFDRIRRLQPFVALAALLLGAVAMLRGGSFADAVSTAAMCCAMCAPFAAGLVSALPIFRLQNRLTRMGAVLPGYSAAEELAGANCVVLEGRELFPRDKVLLHGIKTFDRERVDRAILYAASVLVHSCDTMSHMFLKVIQGKTDMLFEADGVVYEEGLGFSFWVEQNRILVGRRELLEAHEIEVPSRDYENRYTKTSTRDAIYLAVAGKLYAMFVISYAPDEEMAAMLQELVKQNINIIVRTRDFIISAEKIARMYDIPRSMVTVVREGGMQELAKKTEYTQHSASSLTHIGTASSLLQGTVGSYRMLAAAGHSALVALCAMLLGLVIAVVLSLVGALTEVSLVSLAAFQLAWLLIHIFTVWLRKY